MRASVTAIRIGMAIRMNPPWRGKLRLARSQLDDRNGAPHLGGPLAVTGIGWEDAVGKLPEPRSLRVVVDDLRVKRLPAELDVGMGTKIVEPRRVLGQPQLR